MKIRDSKKRAIVRRADYPNSRRSRLKPVDVVVVVDFRHIGRHVSSLSVGKWLKYTECHSCSSSIGPIIFLVFPVKQFGGFWNGFGFGFNWILDPRRDSAAEKHSPSVLMESARSQVCPSGSLSYFWPGGGYTLGRCSAFQNVKNLNFKIIRLELS